MVLRQPNHCVSTSAPGCWCSLRFASASTSALHVALPVRLHRHVPRQHPSESRNQPLAYDAGPEKLYCRRSSSQFPDATEVDSLMPLLSAGRPHHFPIPPLRTVGITPFSPGNCRAGGRPLAASRNHRKEITAATSATWSSRITSTRQSLAFALPNPGVVRPLKPDKGPQMKTRWPISIRWRMCSIGSLMRGGWRVKRWSGVDAELLAHPVGNRHQLAVHQIVIDRASGSIDNAAPLTPPPCAGAPALSVEKLPDTDTR